MFFGQKLLFLQKLRKKVVMFYGQLHGGVSLKMSSFHFSNSYYCLEATDKFRQIFLESALKNDRQSTNFNALCCSDAVFIVIRCKFCFSFPFYSLILFINPCSVKMN